MKLFGHDIKLSLSVQRDPPATLSPAAADWVRGSDIDQPVEGAKLRDPYEQSAWVYVAISVLAENVAQIPWRISRIPGSARKDMARCRSVQERKQFRRRVLGENILEDGPAVELFNNPHPTMDANLFWQMLMTWSCMRGEFFVLGLDQENNVLDIQEEQKRAAGRIRRIITLEPLLFWHMVVGYELQGWRYSGSPLLTPIPMQWFLPSEVLQCRTPNPYLYWRGMSPLIVAMLPAQTDFAAEQFMKGLMLNNADTGVIVTTESQLNEEQRQQMLAALRERKRKAGTADRPLLLWGGAKLEKPQLSSADMQFLENRQLCRREICAIFKVPESLCGFSEEKHSLGGGSGQEQDRLAFVETTLAPHCSRIEKGLLPIVKSFGQDLEGYFDIDSLPILQEARRSRLDAATKAFNMGVPFNALNEVYDLGFPRLPWGDEGFLPFSLQPAREVGKPQEPAQPPEKPGTENADEKNPVADAEKFFGTLSLRPAAAFQPAAKAAPAHHCAANPAWEKAVAPLVKQKAAKMKRFFWEQRGRVLEALPQVLKEFSMDGKAWSWSKASATSRGLDDVFDHSAEDSKLLKALRSLYIADLEFGGAKLYEEINQNPADFKLPPQAAIDFLAARKKTIAQINDQTWDQLRTSLQEGLKAGETQTELEDRVKSVFAHFVDDGMDMSRYETIAQTETNTATNSGRFTGMKSAGVERKGWRTSHLEGTRATHAANERLSAEGGLPLDTPWPNGCMYPGDPDGDASEVINCRCFGYAILGKGGEQ